MSCQRARCASLEGIENIPGASVSYYIMWTIKSYLKTKKMMMMRRRCWWCWGGQRRETTSLITPPGLTVTWQHSMLQAPMNIWTYEQHFIIRSWEKGPWDCQSGGMLERMDNSQCSPTLPRAFSASPVPCIITLPLFPHDSNIAFCFQDRGSPCSPGCPGIYSVDQAGLELIEIHLPLLPKCWD